MPVEICCPHCGDTDGPWIGTEPDAPCEACGTTTASTDTA